MNYKTFKDLEFHSNAAHIVFANECEARVQKKDDHFMVYRNHAAKYCRESDYIKVKTGREVTEVMVEMQELTDDDEITITQTIREYTESMPVTILTHKGRWVIDATSDGGRSCTAVDLIDVIEFVKKYKPELLK